MTDYEKLEMLKDTVSQLYEKEGRSFSYISRLLKVDRRQVSKFTRDNNMEKANCHYMSKSNQKFAARHKQFIISCYHQGMTDTEIANKLGVKVHLIGNIAVNTADIAKVRQAYLDSIGKQTREFKAERKAHYRFDNLPNEKWKEILGYPEYYASNQGRVKHYVKSYDCYRLLVPAINQLSNRLYIKIGTKNFQLARLIAHTFVDGYSEVNNTVDHINNDYQDNRACNLQWVSQAENNKRAYRRDNRTRNVGYSRNGRFKEIVLNDKYRFKTIVALGKFLGVSESQTHRYISGETPFDGKITFVY